MVISVESIQEVCSKILAAVDVSNVSTVTETIELKTENDVLYLNVTNKEYYVSVKLAVSSEEKLHATVNANLFLKLMSQITTENVELKVENNSLIIIGNGTYKLPLIYVGDTMLELPSIVIGNITTQFDINSNILNSINTYNSKELNRTVVTRPVQRLYYIDEKGCITFTTGACVNSFTLSSPIKILINNKIVKLFKLFKNEQVHFKLGHDALSEEIVQTKVKFETDTISITAIINSDESLVSGVPVEAIRKRANAIYPHQISLNKDKLLQTIGRLMLFTSLSKDPLNKAYSKFTFEKTKVTIFDTFGTNKEEIEYENVEDNAEDFIYEAVLDLNDIKSTLENCVEKYVMIGFGDGSAITITRGNIINVIPEIVVE